MKVVNSGMLEPSKYETDYRKMPKQHLNNNIPTGRGMIKWQPFASMPQQYDIINNHIKDQNKTDKPILDDAALNDLNNVLAEKIFYNPIATIKYWDNGYYHMIECEVNKFDSEHNKLEVIDNGDVVRLNMNYIVEIE